MLVSPDWPGQDDAYFRSTIFHEMTHQWVGLIEGRASWFEEGLTVYVTATLPCEAHLSTPKNVLTTSIAIFAITTHRKQKLVAKADRQRTFHK